ncbi:MAG: type II/IV secretion system protein [Planctomycetes bacterium]|nr:type II/IV secretion system protein [Planctomycetota bacterium]
MKKDDPIIAAILAENILDETVVKELVSTQAASGQSFISIIKSKNLVDKNQLTKLTAVGNSIEFITLSPDMIDSVAARLVSFELARQHDLIPVRIEKDSLYVAMSSPMNLSVRDQITTKTGYKVIPLAATTEAIGQAISYNFNVESVTKQDIVAMRLKDSAGGDAKGKKGKSRSAKVADAPIVRLVDSIITGGVDARASDIHIEPQEPDMKVRYRVDGILIEALDVPSSAQREVISHIKILADMDISERRTPQDGHIGIEYNNKEYDLRVSSLPATGGEKIVIRILDATAGLETLDNIVSSQADYEEFQSLIGNPYGMVLLTGPTGSGKTTTLYSMIQYLNTPDRNIVTVEDPVEYRLSGITQVQVKDEVGMTFASGLRSILRQDPDIILIGEIRDLETAEMAISAAQTGHLVLSTLHTNNAAGAISRLVNLGVSPFQTASALLGVIAQRLVRTICPKCKESYKPSKEEVVSLFGSKDAAKKAMGGKVMLYKGSGCDACRQTGYRGRRGLYEILNVVPEVRALVVDSASDDQVKACAIAHQMKTLKMQGVEQVLEGNTTAEELFRVIDMRED